MTSGEDSYKIPLEFTPDTAGLESAQRAAEKFDGTAAELTRTLADLQKQAVATFNAIQKAVAAGGGGTGGKPLSSYAELQALQQAIAGPRYAPVLAQMQQVEALSRQTPRAAPTAPGEEHGGGQSRAATAQRPFSERLTERVLRTSSLSTMGAFAQGEFVAGGRSLARAFIETLATTRPSVGATRTLVGAIATGAGADVAGGAEAGAAGGLAARAAGLLTGPVGIIAAAVASIGAVVLGVNAVRSQVAGQELALRANVSGTAGLRMNDLEGGILGAGQRFGYGYQTPLQTAGILGAAGVGARQLTGGVANTLAMSRLTGMDPSQVAQLTALLMVQGQQSAAMVGRVFAILRDGADRSGVSVTRLVSSLQDLEKATGGTALGARGASGLAVVQGMLGSAVSAGQLLGPALGATGTQALQAAGILGISPDRLQQIQSRGDTAQMFDLMAAAAKRIGGGRTDQTTIDAIEAAFQNAGVLNLAGVPPQIATQTIRTMMTQTPRAAEDEVDRRRRADAAASAAKLQQDGQRAADAATSALARLANAADYARLNLGLLGNDINRLPLGPNAGDAPGAGGPPGASTVPGALVAGPSSPGGRPTAPGPLNRPRTTPLYFGGYTLPNDIFNQYLAASQRYGVPLDLLLAQGAAESSFNPRVVSGAGAAGLAQLTPSLISDLQGGKGIYGDSPFKGKNLDPFVTQTATQAQAYLMSKYLKQEGGNQAQALYDYISGPGRLHIGPPAPAALSYAGAVAGLEVNLSGTLTVQDSKGNRIGTAQIAPQTVTVNPGRSPRGGVKGSGPTPTPPPTAPHPSHGAGGPRLMPP